MKYPFKRIAAVALAAGLTLSMVGSRVSAKEYTGSYMSGKYYRALRQVQLTGDPRWDIVAIAKSQLGYQEGGTLEALSGEVYGGKNFTEYGQWYGMQDMWCAMFVSWCADQAGISTETIPSHSYTPNGLSWFAAQGLAYTRAEVQDKKYTPKPGDIVYFKSSRNARPTNHVGIVTEYTDGRLYTVEGNVGAMGKTTGGGMVAEHFYPITNTYIAFICSVNYENGSTAVPSTLEQEAQALSMESLRQALFAVESGDEIAYDAVNAQWGSIGCGQWYGAQAKNLLSQIRLADPEAYAALDPQGILLEQNGLISCSEEKQLILKQVLSSEAGVQVQNAWMEQQLSRWMDRAKDLGVSDSDALLLCAALYQLRGEAVAEQIISRGADSKEALLSIIKDREPGLYRTCYLLIE